MPPVSLVSVGGQVCTVWSGVRGLDWGRGGLRRSMGVVSFSFSLLYPQGYLAVDAGAGDWAVGGGGRAVSRLGCLRFDKRLGCLRFEKEMREPV